MEKKKFNFAILFNRYGWLIIFGVFFFLRFPSLFEPLVYGDEGIYLALGQARRAGLTLYRDIHDNKPPLLYLIAALSPNFFTYRLIYFMFSLAGFFIFRRLVNVLFPRSKTAQFVSLGVFAVLASIRLLEGQIANAENYIMYLSSAAFLLLVDQPTSLSFLAAGVLFSLSTLFKIPALFDFGAALIVFFFLRKEKIGSLLAFWKQKLFWLFIAGFSLPLILTTVYYYQVGAGPDFVTAALAQNLPYLSSWGAQSKTTGFQLPVSLLGKLLIIGLPVLGLFAYRKHPSVTLPVKISLIWFTCALFAALLSSRPYPHYLLQAVPAFALSFGISVSKPKVFRSLPLIFALTVWLAMEKYTYYHYPTVSYYLNFAQRASGRIDEQTYRSYWGPWATNLPELAAYIASHTLPSEKIFFWGDQPAIYPLADRLPVGRYSAVYHVKDFDSDYTQTAAALRSNPPALFLVDQGEAHSLGSLRRWLHEHYLPVTTIGPVTVYHYLSPQS